MNKLYVLLISSIIILAVSGCSKELTEINPEDNQTQNSDEQQNVNGSQDSEIVDIEWNTSGLSREQIDSINWNADAYKNYFRVDTDEYYFCYWNMSTCLGMLPDGDVLYMNPSQTIVVDAETGQYYESDASFFSGILPTEESVQILIPEIPSAPSEEYYFTMSKDDASGNYIFTLDLLEQRTQYIINENLVCIGWTVQSLGGKVSYFFGDDPGFESVSAQLLPNGVPET